MKALLAQAFRDYRNGLVTVLELKQCQRRERLKSRYLGKLQEFLPLISLLSASSSQAVADRNFIGREITHKPQVSSADRTEISAHINNQCWRLTKRPYGGVDLSCDTHSENAREFADSEVANSLL